MIDMKNYFKKQDLIKYIANSYYHFIRYKITGDKSNLFAFKKCKQAIKKLTKLSIEEINEIIFSVDISNEPIKHIYYQLVEWI